MNRLTNLVFLLLFFNSVIGQLADPAVTSAYFATTTSTVGSDNTLTVNFENSGIGLIPSNSIELTVSTAHNYYKTDGFTIPTGSASSLFTWTYLGNDTWSGVNNVSILPLNGGTIIFTVKGILETNTPQITNINVQPISQFASFGDSPANNNLQPTLSISQAAVACPTPLIIGDFFGCRNSRVNVRVDTFNSNNTYNWTVNNGATVIPGSNGTAIIQLPDSIKGTFNLILTETNSLGCVGTSSATLRIEENLALVCDNDVNISLGENCTIDIKADVILEGQPYPNDSYTVTVQNSNGQPVPNVITGTNNIGKQFKVIVKHDCSGNSCWGFVTLEDKMAPTIKCPDPITVSCYSTQTFNKPTATDNCGGNVEVAELTNILREQNCGKDFAAIRTIRYQAKDRFGNLSEVCERNIFYKYENIDDIIFPKNRDDVSNNTNDKSDDAFFCENNNPKWDFNNNYYPDIEESGFPKLNGQDVKTVNGLCKVNAVFTDQRIDICAKSFKIIRTWNVIDWCSGKIKTGSQIIKVIDNNGPIITCEPDFRGNVFTRPYDCLADYEVPLPKVIYECTDSVRFKVQYLLADVNGLPPVKGKYVENNVVYLPNGKIIIKNLPKGLTWIKILAIDACGNETPCFTEVYVADNIPPVAVCDDFTVISVNNTGFAELLAPTIDDGSYDNCGQIFFEVARVTPGCNTSTQFGPSAIFCCNDIGNNDLMATLRVWDDANCNGIFGDEINLYNDNNQNGILGDPGDRLIGRIRDNSNTCMVRVKVQDKFNPIVICPPNLTIDCTMPFDTSRTGSARVTDNCGPIIPTLTQNININNCGNGTITRTWTARDRAGNEGRCTQVITVRDNTPFKSTDINWNTVPNRELSSCNSPADISPDKMGRPTWRNDECSLVAASYEDQKFKFVEDVCEKILRRWTVIDWCTFNENNPTAGGKYEYIQEIKILNKVAPNFVNCTDRTVCIEGENCRGIVNLNFQAKDDCTDSSDIKYIYTIDRKDDGTIERSGGSIAFSGVLEADVYRVKVTASDGCNNEKDCSFKLTVRDCKKPTPYCYTELTTVIMNNPSKTVAIWARDFDRGSFDNCSGPLRFSFSENTVDTGRVFGCSQLGLQRLKMWVTDAAGNKDFCEVRVDVQDNGLCVGSKSVAGVVTYQDKTPIKDVDLVLSEVNEIKYSVTNNEGNYRFYTNETSGKITPSHDKDILRGVSTLDLVHIQRHILGLTRFTSPYQYIAADVNNNKAVNAADLVSLRKVILGIDTKFPQNKSYRFVDNQFIFADPTKPYDFNEHINLSNRNSNDFIGVKIGDVNNSAPNGIATGDAQPRTNSSMILEIDDISFSNGIIEVPVYAGNNYKTYGFQATVNLDGLSFLDINPGILKLTDNNVAFHQELRKLTMSYSSDHLININENDILFTLVLNADEIGQLIEAIKLSNDITATEAYNEEFDANKIKLQSRNSESLDKVKFEVSQNNPNPFMQNTVIKVSIGSDSDINLVVLDANGKKVYQFKDSYKAGVHDLIIKASDIQYPGLYTFRVETSLGTVTKKMVFIR